MRITNLQINHYKSMEQPLTISRLTNLHILIGPNNAGKTNMLDAIYHLFFPDEDPERYNDPDADLNITIDDKYIISEKDCPCSVSEKIVRVQGLPSDEEENYFRSNFPDEYQEFNNTIQSYFPSFSENKPWRRKGGGLPQLYSIFFYLHHPSYDIVLIDEAENHLHPSLIKRFLRWLLEKNNKQVFLTTHHPAFVQVDSLPYLWQINRERGNTLVYGFVNEEPKIDFDRLVQEIDDDNSGIFFADRVLLVEGVSDRILMQGLISRFYDTNLDIKVVQTRSKGNTDLYAQICDIFHISYMIMLDEDALRFPWPEIVSKKIGREKNHQERINKLKKHNIFLLRRDLETSYPRRYQDKKNSKPLNALHASRLISRQEFESREMRIIKEVLDLICLSA